MKKKHPIHIIKRLSKLESLPLRKKRWCSEVKEARKKLAQIISILYKKKRGRLDINRARSKHGGVRIISPFGNPSVVRRRKKRTNKQTKINVFRWAKLKKDMHVFCNSYIVSWYTTHVEKMRPIKLDMFW